jgi:hypothetical protein
LTADSFVLCHVRKIAHVSDVDVTETHILQMAEDELVLCLGLQALDSRAFLGKDRMFRALQNCNDAFCCKGHLKTAKRSCAFDYEASFLQSHNGTLVRITFA